MKLVVVSNSSLFDNSSLLDNRPLLRSSLHASPVLKLVTWQGSALTGLTIEYRQVSTSRAVEVGFRDMYGWFLRRNRVSRELMRRVKMNQMVMIKCHYIQILNHLDVTAGVHLADAMHDRSHDYHHRSQTEVQKIVGGCR